MTRLLGRVKRLEKGDGSCPVCGFPENTVELHIVEELVVTDEQARAARERMSSGGISTPDGEPDGLGPCEECGRRPVVTVVRVSVKDQEGGPCDSPPG